MYDNGTTSELPRYKCHKEVHAIKIKRVIFDIDTARNNNRETDLSATIWPTESSWGPITVDSEYIRKHNPQAGGYYVVYDDGYKSFSPAEAFEAGYTRIR